MSNEQIIFKQEGIVATEAQSKSLAYLAHNWHGVHVFHGAYGLPEGYLSITLDPNGHPVYGGISPEGDVST